MVIQVDPEAVVVGLPLWVKELQVKDMMEDKVNQVGILEVEAVAQVAQVMIVNLLKLVDLEE